MTSLETGRLVIRNFTGGDWEALDVMIGQYEASEFAAYDHPWPASPEEIRKVTEWFASGDSFLAVCLKDTGRLIGLVSLNREEGDDSREFNFGYIFNFDYHGKGYATEAGRAVLGHAFERLQAQRVQTGTAAENAPSCRLLERLGFRKVAENMASFRTAQDGKPIEFLGYTYVITRNEREMASTHSSRKQRSPAK